MQWSPAKGGAGVWLFLLHKGYTRCAHSRTMLWFLPMITLSVTTRQKKGTKAVRELRRGGEMPVILYGRKEKPLSLSVSLAEFKKVLRVAGESSIVTLTGLATDKDVLIHEISLDPVSDEPRHADFYAVEKDKKLQVNVSLEFIGTPTAVKEYGGILLKVLHELEIEALPKDLPHEITVDVSNLATINAHITAREILLPSGVTLVSDPDEIVVMISEATEEITEPVLAPDLSTIEVEKRGKEEPEEVEEGTS